MLVLMLVLSRRCEANVSSSTVFQGDLVLKGNNVTIIEGRFNINGSIRVEENATLYLQNAVINFTQTSDFEQELILCNPSKGNPRLIAENTSITSNHRNIVWFFDNSTGTLNNCIVTETLDAYDYSNVVVSGSTLKRLEVAGYSRVRLVDSKVVDDIFLSGYNEVFLVNSTFGWLFFDYWAPQIYVAWYLNVHVVDAYDENIPAANVTATFQNGTVAEFQFTDDNGWVSFILLEKVVDPFGNHNIGNYTITATYGTYVEQESVNLNGNKEITLNLPFVIPEFPSAAISPLFIILTLFIAIFVKEFKIKTARLVCSLRS